MEYGDHLQSQGSDVSGVLNVLTDQTLEYGRAQWKMVTGIIAVVQIIIAVIRKAIIILGWYTGTPQ